MTPKSCSNCIHHDVCEIAGKMLMHVPIGWLEYNTFAADLRGFLGEHCPHWAEESEE